jgi:tetratricopeptide (TPR) repeat protein
MTGHLPPFVLEPYRYGTKKWDAYLVDIRQSVDAVGRSVDDATRTLASNARSIARGSDDVTQAALREHASNVIDAIDRNLNAVSVELAAGFDLLASGLEYQSQMLASLTDTVSEAVRVLKHPLLTQADELVRLGIARTQAGLFPEAIRAYEQALSKDETTFIAHLQLGILRLGAIDAECSHVDLAAAREHFRQAKRCAATLNGLSADDARQARGQVLFYSTLTLYALSSEATVAGDHHLAKELLLEAAKVLSAEAHTVDVDEEAAFMYSRVWARVDRHDKARDLLLYAIDMHRRYLNSALTDPDLAMCHDYLRHVDKHLRGIEASCTSQIALLCRHWADLTKEASKVPALSPKLGFFATAKTPIQLEALYLDCKLSVSDALSESKVALDALKRLLLPSATSRLEELEERLKRLHDEIAHWTAQSQKFWIRVTGQSGGIRRVLKERWDERGAVSAERAHVTNVLRLLSD